MQSKTFYALGDAKERTADIRIIAATNQDLKRLLAERKLRGDLYFRLNVLTIEIPGLDARREDIVPLAEHFVRRFVDGDKKLRSLPLSPRACAVLEMTPWPGHVRELENAVRMGHIRANFQSAWAIEPHHLFPDTSPPDPSKGLSHPEAMRRFERAFLTEALTRNRWEVAKTAEEIDVSRAALYKWINVLGLEKPADPKP